LAEAGQEEKIRYQCVRCGGVFEKERLPKVADTRCPVCGYNVMRKARSHVAKLIKTSEIGKEQIRFLG